MSKIIETKQDAKEFLTYIGFLKAGAFKQGHGTLQGGVNPKTGKNDTWAYCALGVGAELFIPDDKKTLHEDKNGNKYMINIFVPQQNAPSWLIKLNNEKIFDPKLNRFSFITSISDSGESFDYIADALLNHFSDQLEEALSE